MRSASPIALTTRPRVHTLGKALAASRNDVLVTPDGRHYTLPALSVKTAWPWWTCGNPSPKVRAFWPVTAGASHGRCTRCRTCAAWAVAGGATPTRPSAATRCGGGHHHLARGGAHPRSGRPPRRDGRLMAAEVWVASPCPITTGAGSSTPPASAWWTRRRPGKAVLHMEFTPRGDMRGSAAATTTWSASSTLPRASPGHAGGGRPQWHLHPARSAHGVLDMRPCPTLRRACPGQHRFPTQPRAAPVAARTQLQRPSVRGDCPSAVVGAALDFICSARGAGGRPPVAREARSAHRAGFAPGQRALHPLGHGGAARAAQAAAALSRPRPTGAQPQLRTRNAYNLRFVATGPAPRRWNAPSPAWRQTASRRCACPCCSPTGSTARLTSRPSDHRPATRRPSGQLRPAAPCRRARAQLADAAALAAWPSLAPVAQPYAQWAQAWVPPPRRCRRAQQRGRTPGAQPLRRGGAPPRTGLCRQRHDGAGRADGRVRRRRLRRPPSRVTPAHRRARAPAGATTWIAWCTAPPAGGRAGGGQRPGPAAWPTSPRRAVFAPPFSTDRRRRFAAAAPSRKEWPMPCLEDLPAHGLPAWRFSAGGRAVMLAVAQALGTTEQDVLQRLQRLLDDGYLTLLRPAVPDRTRRPAVCAGRAGGPQAEFVRRDCTGQRPARGGPHDRRDTLNMWFVVAADRPRRPPRCCSALRAPRA